MENETKIKMKEEIKKLTDQFYLNYGRTAQREVFFAEALPKFSKRIFEKDLDLKKEVGDFIDEYKDKQLGGFNATYGNLHNWLFDFAAAMLEVDELELRIKMG